MKTKYALGLSVKSTDLQELFWAQYRKEWDKEVKALVRKDVNLSLSYMETGKDPSSVTEGLVSKWETEGGEEEGEGKGLEGRGEGGRGRGNGEGELAKDLSCTLLSLGLSSCV